MLDLMSGCGVTNGTLTVKSTRPELRDGATWRISSVGSFLKLGRFKKKIHIVHTLRTYERFSVDFGGSGHIMLFLGVLYFIKLQTLPNNIPEGNPLKSVFLTPKIMLISRPMWSLNGPVVYIYLSTFSQ